MSNEASVPRTDSPGPPDRTTCLRIESERLVVGQLCLAVKPRCLSGRKARSPNPPVVAVELRVHVLIAAGGPGNRVDVHAAFGANALWPTNG